MENRVENNPDSENEEEREFIILNNSQMSASENLGITQEYTGNRKLWDSASAKKNYVDSVFGDKQTIRDENGIVLHKSHKAAKNKYHQKNAAGENVSAKWSKYAAEVDHKISLESLHKQAKHNPFLSDSDLREIANCKENYQILSKRQNASKGADNSANLITHASLHGKFAARTAANAAGEFAVGASESVQGISVQLIANSLQKLVIEGESLEDTAKSAGKAVVNAAVVGGAEKLLIDTATHIFANSGNAVLNQIVQMNAVGQCLVLGAAVGTSALKYLDGEITTEQFADEILMNGAAIGISTIVGIAVPVPLLAPIVSCIAVRAIHLLHQTRFQFDEYTIKESKIRDLEREAIAEMDRQRRKFHELVQENLNEWDSVIETAFQKMISASFEDSFDLDGIISGLDQVLSLCGEKARFRSVKEWESQLDMPLELSF